jgi:hypothetical protein
MTQEIQFRVDSRQHRNLWKAKFDSNSFSSMNESQAVTAMASKVSQTFKKAIEKDIKKRR